MGVSPFPNLGQNWGFCGSQSFQCVSGIPHRLFLTWRLVQAREGEFWRGQCWQVQTLTQPFQGHCWLLLSVPVGTALEPSLLECGLAWQMQKNFQDGKLLGWKSKDSSGDPGGRGGTEWVVVGGIERRWDICTGPGTAQRGEGRKPVSLRDETVIYDNELWGSRGIIPCTLLVQMLASNLANTQTDPHIRFNTAKRKKERKKNLPDRVKGFKFLVKICTRKQ